MRSSPSRAICAAAVGLAVLVAAAGVAPARPGRPPEPLPRLHGPALSGPVRLHLVVAGAGGGAFVLDADRGTTRTVGGLGLGGGAAPSRASLAGLWSASGGVLAEVQRFGCSSCGTSTTVSLIGPGAGVRRVASIVLHGGSALVPAFGAAAFWRLSWPNGGPCSLGRVPGGTSTVTVPCGHPAAATSAGVWIRSASREAIVDPLSGRAVASLAIPAEPGRATWLYPLHGTLALEYSGPSSSFTGIQGGDLRLVDLAGGTPRRLAWPSWFRGVIRVVPEPEGPLVAVSFGSPAWPGPPQAEDVWVLDTDRGSFTHVPGYPAQVAIKFSSVLWTADGRLAIVAQGGGRAVLALWRPGTRTLPLRVIPSRNGYTMAAQLGG